MRAKCIKELIINIPHYAGKTKIIDQIIFRKNIYYRFEKEDEFIKFVKGKNIIKFEKEEFDKNFIIEE